MASIWKGSLTFGLVNIPVELKTPVRATRKAVGAGHKPARPKKRKTV